MVWFPDLAFPVLVLQATDAGVRQSGNNVVLWLDLNMHLLSNMVWHTKLSYLFLECVVRISFDEMKFF